PGDTGPLRLLRAVAFAPTPGCARTTPATPGISPLSLHDALPISARRHGDAALGRQRRPAARSARIRARRDRARAAAAGRASRRRSEEHTSELQSRENLVCRLLLEKKKCNAGRRSPRVDAEGKRST